MSRQQGTEEAQTTQEVSRKLSLLEVSLRKVSLRKVSLLEVSRFPRQEIPQNLTHY
jgi:hypothetical protein